MDGIRIDTADIFMPEAMRRVKESKLKRTRFVHYTSAVVLQSILRDGAIWMRNVRCMNDISEVRHGVERIKEILESGVGRGIIKKIDDISGGAGSSASREFFRLAGDIIANTYVTCISEHDDTEDSYGRLSMWRAYGREAVGVAIVLNTSVLHAASDALHAYASPVAYFTDVELLDAFVEAGDNIVANVNRIRRMSPAQVTGDIINAFIFAVTSLKHPGFKEEREWRVIHLPIIDKSRILIKETVNVSGVPQTIYKIPLKEIPNSGMFGMSPDSLFERVIIGPSNYPGPVRDAIIDALAAASVSHPDKRVVVSDIPLRMTV